MSAYARLAPIWITAAVLIFAPSAQALVQIDQGIAGARLGNTRDQVRAALGKPIKIKSAQERLRAVRRVPLLRRHPRHVPGQGESDRGRDHRQGRPDDADIGVGSSEADVGRRSRASSARASARRAPATPATSSPARSHRLPHRRTGTWRASPSASSSTEPQAPELARQADRVEDRLRLPRACAGASPGRGGRRTSGGRARPASRGRPTRPPLTSSSDRRSRIVAQVKAMSSHQCAAGTSTWKTASSSWPGT